MKKQKYSPELLQQLRKASGLTLRQIEAKTSINHKNICRYENGEVTPNVSTLEVLLNGLGYEIVIEKKE